MRISPKVCRKFYKAAREPKKGVQIEGADHSFSKHRIPLIRGVLDGLKTIL